MRLSASKQMNRRGIKQRIDPPPEKRLLFIESAPSPLKITTLECIAMRIYEVQTRSPLLLHQLLTVWEASVSATHHFLSAAEVQRIKTCVPQTLGAVSHLVIAEKAPGQPIAFMGINGIRLEMLFLLPAAQGAGLGRQLLTYGIDHFGIQELTVNEQNPQAVGFYLHMGFTVFKRTDRDEEGNPYPLLYMRRNTPSSVG